MQLEIMIDGGGRIFCPAVEQGIEWITERRGVPDVLKFTMAADGGAEVEEGNSVILQADGKTLFSGFIFCIERGMGGLVKIRAYDQLRYLKNRDSYIFEEMTASERITVIAQDFGLQLGEIADTVHVLPPRVEENTTLIDMMLGALDETLTATGRLYHLWDAAGMLTLKPAEEMVVGLLLDGESGEGYRWESSIDEQTSNRIKLVHEDEKTGARQVTLAQDEAAMEKWGTLQHFEVLSEGENAQAKAELMLSLYNTPNRKLKLSGVAGDMRLRAGCLVAVQMEEVGVNGLVLVEKCRHLFLNGAHTMELELRS